MNNMELTVSITPKWQIHIPVAIRKKLKLTKPSQAVMTLRDDEIVIKPKKSQILAMGGKYKHLKPVKPINLDRVRDYIDYSQW
jgi:AbrB family looped-hinge helix DNA binding protein